MQVSVASFRVSEAASFLARRRESTQCGTWTFTTTRFGVFAAEAALGELRSLSVPEPLDCRRRDGIHPVRDTKSNMQTWGVDGGGGFTNMMLMNTE